MDTPRRGSKLIARGRAKQHPGNYMDMGHRPERAKALNINNLHCAHICFCPFRAQMVSGTSPGVPLRSAPGYELAAPAGRTNNYGMLHVFS